MKVLFISLGCDKNLVDSEFMLGKLTHHKFTVTDDEQEADIIVINTCCFIHDAKEESIQSILDMAQYRTGGNCKALIVCGCLAERYRDEILKEIPEVDAVLGTNSTEQICDAIEKVLLGDKYEAYEPLTGIETHEAKRSVSTGGHYAHLKIAEGCSKHCTYCIIPSIRGDFRSVPMEEILSQAQDLAEAGVKELILVAQETTLYGKDLYGEKSLHKLLKELCKVSGIQWIRILYCYPEEITDELIQVIKEEPKICHYLDLPIQHANDEILKRMGRRTSKQELVDIVTKLRKEIPDICLRTTLITGFPGETEEDFQETLDVVRKVRYDSAFTFQYSKRTGTPAAVLEDQISPEVMKDRFDRLLKEVQTISAEVCSVHKGTIQRVLVETKNDHDEHLVTGRMSNNLLVHFPGDASLIGKLVDVELKECHGFYYMGEIVS